MIAFSADVPYILHEDACAASSLLIVVTRCSVFSLIPFFADMLFGLEQHGGFY